LCFAPFVIPIRYQYLKIKYQGNGNFNSHSFRGFDAVTVSDYLIRNEKPKLSFIKKLIKLIK
jgi:hypothetical protein